MSKKDCLALCFQKVIYEELLLFVGKFLYLQYKEYSILLIMESSQIKMSQLNPLNQQVHRNIQKTQKQQSIVVKERKDSSCCFKEQNKVLSNLYHIQNSQKLSQGLQDIKFWRLFLIGISLAQFSIQISVILIQYISSKIGLALFVTLISITLTLAILVFLSLKMLSIQKISLFSKVSPQPQLQQSIEIKQVEKVTPTVAKIRNTDDNRVYQKTQKLKPVINTFHKQAGNSQTLKRLKNVQNKKVPRQNKPFFSTLSLITNMYLIIVTKIVQNIFSLIICTICICTIQNPVRYGFGFVTFMLTFFYILATFSSASLICMCLKIKSKVLDSGFQAQNKEIVINLNNHCQIVTYQDNQVQKKVQTVLSIDKYIINTRDEEKLQKMQVKSIENIIKNDQGSQTIQSPSNQVKQKQFSESKSLKRCATQSELQRGTEVGKEQKKIPKKSMLKSNRKYKTKLQISKQGEKENQIRVQRRKVQINSKKIQFFEYANISPANSQRISEDQHKSYSKTIYEKSKIFSQRAKYQQQKIMNEDKLLQRKKQQNIKRSLCKSAKLPSQKSHKDKSLREDPSKFQQYFS